MFDKYKWKLRILYVETPSYKNDKYIKIKDEYDKNIKEFHKYYIKMITKRNKDYNVNIKLIGFDGKIKKKYERLSMKQIIKDVKDMPLGKMINTKPTNLSLYSDYNKETSNKNFGYKDKNKAIETIKILNSLNNKGNENIKYKKSVISTMLGRAKSHPNQTKDMREAIKIFEIYLKNN